ncbi:MAG TPA: DUF4012 domain-containing protein, partial [Candidatus Woesebacteria bacterium]|nr:DUF4012 domain-containing protein [Candidatus Woesebacteria bacterium]
EENRKKKGNVIRNSIDDKRELNPSVPDKSGTPPLDRGGREAKHNLINKKKFEVMVEEDLNPFPLDKLGDLPLTGEAIQNPVNEIRNLNPSPSTSSGPPLDKGGSNINEILQEEEFEIKPIVGKKEDVISNTIDDKRNTNPTPLRKLGDLPLTGEAIQNPVNEIREEEEEFEIKPLISPLPERKIIRDTINDKRNTISDIRYTENKDVIGNTINDKRKTRDWGRYVKIAVGGVAIIMILMGMLRVVNYVLAIDSWVKSLKEGKIEKIAETNKNIKLVSAKNIKTIENFGWNNSLSGRKIWKGLKMVEEGSEIVDLGIELNESGEKIGEGVFGEKEIEVIKELEISQQKLEEINKRLGVVQAKLNDDWNWIPGRWRGEINKAKKSLPEYREKISKATKMVPVLKEMLGGDGKRREYMVLFQNESELRPGGGFIGSFGILSFENGKMLGLEVKDIYEIDGQLKGHVEPPEAIKTILGEGGWYLRDANWKPNMVEASKDILWFFEKETGRRVDGLVTMNLAVAKGWLGVLGEIMVPDFKVKINKDNLYEQAEFYAETKFFPGSNQKGSFLGGLATVMMEEIKTAKGIEKLKLLETSLNLLDENEIQLVINEKKINNILTDLGWNGMMYQGKCKSDRCVADYWYGVEANLGVNKANYFIYRNVEQQVEIGSNAVARIAKITYENSAKNSNWPGGDYKNYLRVYIPAEANVAEVSVTSNDGTKTVYGGDSLKITNNDGKKEIGLLVVVPVASKRIVEVRYNLAIDLNKENKFSYMLYQQKQSGYGDTGLVNLITVPSGWQVSQVEPAATVMNNKLLFNQKFKKDLMIGVEIEK